MKKQYPYLDSTEVFETYKGLWVALDEHQKVISADPSAKKTHEDALKKGYNEPILFKVPKRNIAHIG